MLLVVYALAAARVTRLLVSDKIAERPRNAMQAWLLGRDRKMLWYLSTCPWCVSVWVGLVAALVWYLWGAQPWAFIPAAGLAISYIAGWLAGHEGKP